MHNRIKIKWRGKRKYFATEIPIQYRQGGEARKEIMATSREELERKFDEEVASRKLRLDRAGGRRLLSDFLVSEFLPFYRNEVEPQTWCDYRHHIEARIAPGLGAIRLEDLTARHVDQWTLSLRETTSKRTGRPLSDRTIDYSLAILRRALQFAVDWRYVSVNPASSRVRAARRRKRVRISTLRFLSPDQAKQFLDAVRGDRFEALYTLAITTGMRQGELFGLNWSDVDLAASKVTINHSLAHTKRKRGEAGDRVILKGPKTTGSRRTIEIPQVTVAALQTHRQRQVELHDAAGDGWCETGFVFTSRRGTPIDRGNALHRFQDILKEHALPRIRFYDLRHARPRC
ncbi:MAG: site-specific integrase [Bryobacterales bacterium]|nr:site-specific integrase [Bryobacterales bacterium]